MMHFSPKRQLASAAISTLRLPTSLLKLRRRTGSSWLTVLTYHRAGPGVSLELLDNDVLAASAAAFERQMAFAKRFFDVVGIDDVLRSLNGAPLPPSPMLVTFDDGYLDNYEVAFPILQRLGVKATFFVATGYIEDRRLFWWDRINYLLKSSRREVIELSYPYPLRLALTPSPAAAITTALRIVKDYFALDLPRFLAHLSRAADVDIDRDVEQALVRKHIMTWDHVRALRRGGMDVQSHTRTHRVLHTMTEAELAEELVSSRLMLENVLGEPIRALAYPVGRAPSYPQRIRNAIVRAGYDLGFSNRTGINAFESFDAFDAKRITIEPDYTDSLFASVLALPALA